MPYRIKSSLDTNVFGEIRKLKHYDRDAIASAKAGTLTDEVGNPVCLGDLVRAGDGMPLFSEKLVELSREKGISGFQSFRVKVSFQGQDLTYYYLEPERSLKPIPENRIVPGTLDLNNIFLPGESMEPDKMVGIQGTFELLCGERIKGLIQEAGCTLVDFEQVDSVPFDEDGNPLFFYSFGHGWANKYFWLDTLEPYTKWKNWSRPEIKCIFSRYSGTTVGDAHGSGFAETYVSPRVKDFIQSLGSDVAFHRIKTGSSLGHAELYHMEVLNRIPDSRKRVFDVSIRSTVKDSGCGDMSRWDGRDPFGIEGTLLVLMSRATKKLMEAQRFQNVEFSRMRYLVRRA